MRKTLAGACVSEGVEVEVKLLLQLLHPRGEVCDVF